MQKADIHTHERGHHDILPYAPIPSQNQAEPGERRPPASQPAKR